MRSIILFFALYLGSCGGEQNPPVKQETTVGSNTGSVAGLQPLQQMGNSEDSIYSAIINEKTFFLLQHVNENQLQHILGTPESVQLDTLKNADTQNGSIIRTIVYPALILKIISRPGDSINRVTEITWWDQSYKLTSGITVNNRVAELKKRFPRMQVAKDGRSKKNQGFYILYNSNESKRMEVSVIDGIIKSVKLSYFLK